jgi:hypothetical protein
MTAFLAQEQLFLSGNRLSRVCAVYLFMLIFINEKNEKRDVS